jgi:hypothetical protein
MQSHLRGQRISRNELIQESRDVLKNSGVRYHSRALLLSLATSEVISSEDPAFQQLHPRILERNTTPWVNAYAIVLQYLAEHNLSITLDTAGIEKGERFPTTSDSGLTADSRLQELIEAAPPKRKVSQIVSAGKQSPEIELPKPRNPSRRSGLDSETLNAVKTATRTSPVSEKKEVVKGKTVKARTPRREEKTNLLHISSPRRKVHEITSDSDFHSDFVIEEIRPRASKK